MATSKGSISDKVQEYMKKGQWNKAIAEMEKLLAMDKSDPLVNLRLGDLYVKAGDKSNAAKYYMTTATLFNKQGHVQKALATYKMILRTDPSYEGVQEKIDEIAGQPAQQKPSYAGSSLKVDLAKAIPGLEEVPTEEHDLPPGLQPNAEPPTYEIDTQGNIRLDAPELEDDEEEDIPPYGTVSFDSKEEPAFEIETGRADDTSPAGANSGIAVTPDLGEPDLSEGAGDEYASSGYELETTSSAYELETTGSGYELEPAEDTAEEPTESAAQDDGPKQIPLLFDLSQEEMWDILSRMKRRSFNAGEIIVKEGEEGDSLFIIRSGDVKVVTRVGNKEIELARLGERDFFGEVSFLTGRPRTADIVADSQAEVMELTREDLNNVIEMHPKVAGVLRLFHESRVADTVNSLKAVAKDFFK